MAVRIPAIKGKVFKIRDKDNDSMFPLARALAETKPPILPIGFHPLLKPPLQVLYELSYHGHDELNPVSFKAMLKKEENQRDNNNDDENYLSSPKFTNSFIDAINPGDVRVDLGFFQALFPGYK